MDMSALYPFVTLLVGLAIVVLGIVVLRINAFLALITAAMVVSFMAPGEWSVKAGRVATSFGETATGVGIVIALAAIIGKAMIDSGAADRIVKLFLDWFGEKRSAGALTASGFTLAIPVFFDTVFYLLVPLARSMYRQTGRHYLKYLLAIVTCAVAHALVPPTPGPLVVAQILGVDLGVMIVMGIVVAAPGALAGLWFGGWLDRQMTIEIRPIADEDEPVASQSDEQLPSLALSLAPIILPTLLIAANTVTSTLAELNPTTVPDWLAHTVKITAVAGNPNFALLLSAAMAVLTWVWLRRPGRDRLAKSLEQALMSGGVIILITAAGGAFGGMLKLAGLAEAIKALFGESSASGLPLLLAAFLMASLLKVAQGSTTAAMLVTAGMFAAMIEPSTLGFHPVYVALAIGSGGLVGSWMNDSGFWIFARMGGLTELETLKSWTPLLALMGCVCMSMTLLLALLLPMALK